MNGPAQSLLRGESIFADRPSHYVQSLSPDRFLEEEWRWETARQQAQRVYENYYSLAKPTMT